MPDENKEIEQASLSECLPNGRVAVSFAQALMADVGMRGIRVIGTRIWFHGDDAIGRRAIQFRNLEANFEGAELDALQLQAFRLNRDEFLGQIPFDVSELVVK